MWSVWENYLFLTKSIEFKVVFIWLFLSNQNRYTTDYTKIKTNSGFNLKLCLFWLFFSPRCKTNDTTWCLAVSLQSTSWRCNFSKHNERWTVKPLKMRSLLRIFFGLTVFTNKIISICSVGRNGNTSCLPNIWSSLYLDFNFWS